MAQPPSDQPSPSPDDAPEQRRQTDRQPDRQSKDRRKSVVDRRHLPTGLERRRGVGRRRSDFEREAEEGQMSQEQFLFIKAIDAYKRVNQRPYPTWTEVLEVIRKLGYRKTAPMSVYLEGVEEWFEPADAPAVPNIEHADPNDDPNADDE